MSEDFSWGEKETRFFFELTPDRILDSVEKTGVKCTGRCLQLNSMENRVYEVELDLDERVVGGLGQTKEISERFLIVKFYRPGRWTKDQIQDEHDFLFDLIEYEIPVVAPLKDESGASIHRLDTLDIYFSVFPKVGGRNPDELDNEKLAMVGRLLARLHNVGAAGKANHRISLTPDSYGLKSLDFLYDSNTLPDFLAEEYGELVEDISEVTKSLMEDLSIQRVHGDCHLGNLLWGDRGPFWVDFDDMCNAPCVQDIWLVVPGRDESAVRQREHLLASYEQMRSFNWKELELIEPLRTLRIVHFNAWISKRWQDPIFPKSFPEFGTEKYWLEQLQMLRDQADLIL